MTSRDVKSDIREIQRSWLRKIIAQSGISASELAVNAGVADVTVTRFLNNKDYKGVLSPLIVEKLKLYAGSPGPTEEWSENTGEATPLDQIDVVKPAITRMVNAALDGRNEARAWLLNTSALESLGYRSGDVVIVDNKAGTRAGSAVCAQRIDLKGKPEIIFRIYEPPYLIGSSSDLASRKPILVDNERVIVLGPITEMFRAPQN